MRVRDVALSSAVGGLTGAGVVVGSLVALAYLVRVIERREVARQLSGLAKTLGGK